MTKKPQYVEIDTDYHMQLTIKGLFVCGFCGKKFPTFYENERRDSLGDRGRYNFRGAKANFNRHVRSCNTCPICKWVLENRMHFAKHILDHHSSKAVIRFNW